MDRIEYIFSIIFKIFIGAVLLTFYYYIIAFILVGLNIDEYIDSDVLEVLIVVLTAISVYLTFTKFKSFFKKF